MKAPRISDSTINSLAKILGSLTDAEMQELFSLLSPRELDALDASLSAPHATPRPHRRRFSREKPHAG